MHPGIRRWFFLGSALAMAHAGIWWFASSWDPGFQWVYPVHAVSAAILVMAAAVAFRRGLHEHLQHTIQRQVAYSVREAALYGLAGAAALFQWYVNVPWQFQNGYQDTAIVLTFLLPAAVWMFNRALHDYSAAAKDQAAGRPYIGLSEPATLSRP